ncbi:unnamed protein product [Allacma fusca]|uniref:Uncharacterized protein n=1 Tax=Allacma fusca TaxID=39272 RepID=A0A8J2PDF7_9HEXA|nr:unnamed protein product [Allacma fusca]
MEDSRNEKRHLMFPNKFLRQDSESARLTQRELSIDDKQELLKSMQTIRIFAKVINGIVPSHKGVSL